LAEGAHPERTLLEGLRVLGYIVGQELESNKPAELHILSLVDNTHTAAAQLLDDAVMRDGLADHWRESYVCETGKSMKAVELALPPNDCCCKIPVTLNDQRSKRVNA
jgi:hypothetical protein